MAWKSTRQPGTRGQRDPAPIGAGSQPRDGVQQQRELYNITTLHKHLRKLPFWNKNTSQDKACLLAVPQLRRARVTTHPQGDGRSQRAFRGWGGSCWRQEQGGSGQPVAQPWHRAGGTSSPRSPRCALRQ